MGDQASILIAIMAMAAVTLACRCGGYFLFARISPSPFLRRALAHLPGCIFAAYVVPALIAGPAGNWLGAAATVASMLATRNLGVSIAAGVAAAWAVRVWL
jgi:uncharacterized membrane protein